MSTAQSFCEALPWTLDFLWQGKSGIHRLDDERRATVSIETRGYGGRYVGVNVTITSKHNGPIASKFFYFDDHLTGRADDQADRPLAGDTTFLVRGWNWYIAIPANPEHFTQAVETWIGEWT